MSNLSSVNKERKGPYGDNKSKITSTSVLHRSVGASSTPAGSGTDFKSWEASGKATPTNMDKCGGADGGAMARHKDKEKNQNIQVFVRVRAINLQEISKHTTEIIDTPGSREVVVKERSVANLQKTFTFDRVFGQKSKQIDVYKQVVAPLLSEVLLGYNCTVFAYGQTGTGKTFTMEGERKSNFGIENDPLAGMLPRALSQLFDDVRMMDCEFSVRASFLELYNEELFDLLAPIEDSKAKTLRLFEDTSRKGSVIIQGLEEVIVNNKQEVYAVLDRGSQQRKTAATLMNASSSRSHTVFTITVHMKESSVDGEEMVKVGKLNLVDLAGSENIGKSGAVDKRAREAGNINQSLLTLGRVISALVERAPHVPYRESKLTRLLQDSLGGKTKTSIIATISPAAIHIEETLSTLDYAHRAKNIMNRPEVNQRISKKEAITMYTDEIERLRKDLTAAREKSGFYIDPDNYNNMQAQIQSQRCELNEKSNKIKDLEDSLQAKEDEIKDMNDLMEDLKLDNQTKQTILENLQAQKKKMEDKLNQYYKKNDELKYLLKYHEGTELKMSSEAHTLLDTANDTVSMIEQLHGRLERKQHVKQTNWKNADRFRDDFRKAVNDIIDEVQDVKQKHTIGISSLREILNVRSTERRGAFEGYSATINYATGKIETVQTTMGQLVKKFREVAAFRNDALTNLVEKTTICAHTTMADNVRCVYELMDILKKELSGIREVLGTLHNDIHIKFDRMNSVIWEALKGDVHRFSQTEKALIGLRDHWSTIFKEVNSSCLDTNKEVSSFQEDFNKRIDKFTEELANLKADAEANFNKVTSSTDLIQSKMTEGVKLIEQRYANEGNNIKEKRMQTEGVLKKREQFRNDIVTAPQTLLLRLQDRIANNERTVSGTQKQIEDMQMFVSKTLTSVTANVSDHGDITSNELGKVDSDLTEVMESQLESILKLKEQCNKSVKVIIEGEDKTTVKIVEHVDQQCDLVSTACTEISSGLAQSSGSVDEFFEETYLTDSRTGGTPMRRKFDFPTNLSQPSPPARVIARYRGLKTDAQSKISEADDSSDLNSSVGTITDDHEKLSQPIVLDMNLTEDDIGLDIENEDPKPVSNGSKNQEKITPRDFPAEGSRNAAQEEDIPSTPSSHKSDGSDKSAGKAQAQAEMKTEKGGKKRNKRKSGGNKGVLRAPN